MSSTALLGFASVGAFLALVLATRTPVIVALLLTPLVAALAGGFGGEIGTFAIEGIKTVAPVAALIKAMAEVLAGAFPEVLSPWLSLLVAITSMPLSLVFTPDAYYFGVLPVFAETAAAMGHDPLAIGRAAILGQMTTGFPLSPLTAATFILVGLSQVSLRDHQRFVFMWAFGTTLVMTAVAWLTGAL